MNVIILAAGFCTRLQPLTSYFPKGLLTVSEKSIVQYVMDDMMKLPGIGKIVLITNHRYVKLFDVWLKATYPDRQVEVIDNGVTAPESRLGAIGDLLFAADRLGEDEDLMVLSSDTLVSLSLSAFVEFFRKNRGVVTAVYKTPDRSVIAKKLGCALVEGDKLVGFVEKPADPPSDLLGVPFYLFPKESLPLIRKYKSEGGQLDAPGSILSYLIGKVPTYAYLVGNGGYYYDVGTIDVYNSLSASFHPASVG